MSTTSPAPLQAQARPRLRDWQSRLAALLAEREARPFVWGEHDCGLFVADACVALTGHDPVADLRGRYRSAAGAARLLKPLGGVPGLARQRFGAEILPSLAQPGDVGLMLAEERPTLMLCLGAQWAGPGEQGLQRVAAALITQAWRCA